MNELLEKIAETLDIPDHLYEEATIRYEKIAEWLAAADSTLNQHSPEIYPQGSFRLGTAIRPIAHEDEYDIDLVCRLSVEKSDITQAELKKRVGDRLRLDAELSSMLEPSRRCWTLNFPGRFHMDVLPAIPNQERPPTAILLTDRDLRNWQHSNPIAYAEWFRDRMKVLFQQKRASLAEVTNANIDDIPEWKVRTPLQRVVQLLKRHRDIFFQNKIDDRPASIIITTLAARAYSNQADLAQALSTITLGMPSFVTKQNGKWRIENPVDPDENFADKWNEDASREVNFSQWIQKAQMDFTTAIRKASLSEAADALSPVLGGGTIRQVSNSLGINATRLPIVSPINVPALADTTHCWRPSWTERISHQAGISATVYLKKQGRKKLWALSSRSLPKGIWLKFALKTNVPPPYDVQWQVVNTGREAAAAKQLRGDFYQGDDGSSVRWESVAYAGTHWVEAFVVKNGICLARSGRQYVKVHA